MTEIVNYTTFMETKTKHELSVISDNIEAIKYLVDHPSVDVVSFIKIQKLVFFNIAAIQKDNTGRLFYLVAVDRDADVIEDIQLEDTEDIKLEVFMYNRQSQTNCELLLFSAPYTHFSLKLLFSKLPTKDTEIRIRFRCAFLNKEIRSSLRDKSVKTKHHVYRDGLLCELNFK